MATTTSKLLHVHPKLKPFPHPKPKFFSSNPNNENLPPPPPPSDPHPTPTPTPTPTQKPFSFSSISNNPSPKTSPFDEIRKNLAEFRFRAAGSSSPSPSPSPPSLRELYEKNVQLQKPTPATGQVDFSAIRENLHNLQENNKGIDPLSLSRLQDSFRLKPNMGKDVKRSGFVIGGSGGSENFGNLPASIFGKEMMMRGKEGGGGDKEGVNRGVIRNLPASIFGKEMMMRGKGGGGSGDKEGMMTDFVRLYSYGHLGEKLKMLRPSKKDEKGWFSLNELKDRMVKVRESEEKDGKSILGGDIYHALKGALEKMDDDGEKSKKPMIQRLDVLGQLGGTPSFMLHPPKEHLVEKFFHPDNMSSAEKMKLELQKVRDEFKMSESDCGSSRVQVAQLTTKIKHLSSVLHKKDKHSRKGLQEMVQKRKKLLKYLRRTDWDSYCLVLSKLGLRDNPDYKF